MKPTLDSPCLVHSNIIRCYNNGYVQYCHYLIRPPPAPILGRLKVVTRPQVVARKTRDTDVTSAFFHYLHRRDQCQPPNFRGIMSSPVNFPDSDVDMQEEESAEQSMPGAPRRQPLFDPATPSTTRGTPRQNVVPSTPGIMARRALGVSTPKSAPRTPLFEGAITSNLHSTQSSPGPSGKFIADEFSEFISEEDPKSTRATVRW